ncbi:MAG: hypothetical protein GY841_22365, partial [FCB group bacterium]|nr:hypothetical protein [FCB group bacterium]
ERVAELINIILKDDDGRAAIVEGQRKNLERFSIQEVRRRLSAVIDFLRKGKGSGLFKLVGGADPSAPC